MDAKQTIQILTLLLTVEPQVAGYIQTLLENAQGKSGDEFLAEADSIWNQIRTNAKKELGTS